MTNEDFIHGLVGDLRAYLEDAGADATSVTWGPVTVHVTADSARAATPMGVMDLATPGGVKALGERIALEPEGVLR